MRLLPLLVLAACSASSAPTVTARPPADPPDVAIDAAVAVAVAPTDAAQPEAWCMSRGTTLYGFVEKELVLCEDWRNACWAMRSDGPVRQEVPEDDEPIPSGHPFYEGDRAVGAELCTDGATCTRVSPKLAKSEAVWAVAAHPTSSLAALVIRGAKVRLELWDYAKPARLAQAVVVGKGEHGYDFIVEFVGDTILVEYPGATSAATWWKRDGKKLEQLAAWTTRPVARAVIGAGHAAFAIGDLVAVHDMTTGEQLGATKWTAILSDEDMDPEHLAVRLVGADDVVGVMAARDAMIRSWSAGVVWPLGGGDPVRIAPPLCD